MSVPPRFAAVRRCASCLLVNGNASKQSWCGGLRAAGACLASIFSGSGQFSRRSRIIGIAALPDLFNSITGTQGATILLIRCGFYLSIGFFLQASKMKVALRAGSILFGPEFSYAVARRWALNLFNQERATRVNINAKRKKQAGAILSA